MWQRIVVLFFLVPFLVLAEDPKPFVLKGNTWVNGSAADHALIKTIVVEQDSLGRVSRVSVQEPKASSDFDILYGPEGCQYSFTDTFRVVIRVEMKWRKISPGTWEISRIQQNEVPETTIGKTKYPRKTVTKNSKVVLKVSTEDKYSWVDGNSQFVCSVGKNVVWDLNRPETGQSFQTILDGHTSDASKETSLKMNYTKQGEVVRGKQFWQYEAIAWEGNEAAWYDGGSIEYSGRGLSTKDPFINVVNYTILTTRFYDDAWTYFGPSLFGIPIR